VRRWSASSTRDADNRASAAISSASIVSAGGALVDLAISSAIARASSGLPRRVASRAVMIRSDYSYQPLVLRPYAP
jgi:hypothetical protein